MNLQGKTVAAKVVMMMALGNKTLYVDMNGVLAKWEDVFLKELVFEGFFIKKTRFESDGYNFGFHGCRNVNVILFRMEASRFLSI